jgi:transcriptional pleiotropic regulator of transition state genes
MKWTGRLQLTCPKLKIKIRRINSMKSTGIVRKVDELGRVVLPIELRRTMDIEEKDALEIYVDDSTIILKKHEPECIFCGEAKDVQVYKGKNICPDCMKELRGS